MPISAAANKVWTANSFDTVGDIRRFNSAELCNSAAICVTYDMPAIMHTGPENYESPFNRFVKVRKSEIIHSLKYSPQQNCKNLNGFL